MKVRITSVRDKPNTKELLIGYQINDNGSVGYLTYTYISLQRIINDNDNILVIITSHIKIMEEEKEKHNEEKAKVKAVLKSLVGQEIEV